MQRALPPEAAASLWRLLVGRYFPLSREARELWPSDPEEYLAQGETGEGEGWREVLYAVLVRSHRKVKAAAGATDPAALLARDATYKSLGARKGALSVPFELMEAIGFGQHFAHSLVHEVGHSP